jgi:hypothetical protein
MLELLSTRYPGISSLSCQFETVLPHVMNRPHSIRYSIVSQAPWLGIRIKPELLGL